MSDLNADVIKAAAASPLGIIALVICVLSIVALAFFRDASHRMRAVVFAGLAVGFIGVGAAILAIDRDRGEAPAPIPAAAAKAAPPKLVACRLPAHGVERWVDGRSTAADSGWIGGGSSPEIFCEEQRAAKQAALGSSVVKLLSFHEESRDAQPPLRLIQYRYTCAFEEQDPVYNLRPSADCPAP